MPIYEYECKGCGKVFEIFQKIGDEPLKECRVCHGELTKLISHCAFHLKGTGWYATDYKSPVDAARGSGGGKAGNGSKAAEKKEEKSEKPETTAAASTSGDSGNTKSDTSSKSAST